MPTDVIGMNVFDPAVARLPARAAGPVFTQVLMADEINRTPPKTQSALLEAMQERQVTIDGASHPLEPEFFVMATENPVEFEGTYPLPEAQLDRFLLRIEMGCPRRRPRSSSTGGRRAARLGGWSGGRLPALHPVVPRERRRRCARQPRRVHVAPELLPYLARPRRAPCAARRTSSSA